jgi:hypothetical protein
MDRDVVYGIASRVRKALEVFSARDKSGFTSIGPGFPSACCDDSSMILATYLAEQGYPGATRVHGTHGGTQDELNSHVWLTFRGLIIDITADQFESYGQPPVIVEVNSAFHDGFERAEADEPAEFRKKFALDHRWLGCFEATYQQVKAIVDDLDQAASR